jgi:hypothetical protein
MEENNVLKVSFSSLNWLAESPRYFQAMVTGEIPKEESKSLDFGKVVHCYLLRPNDFNNEYDVLNCKQPINKQQYDFCKFISDGMNYEEAYKNSYSIKSKTEKSITSEATKLYIELKDYSEKIKNQGTKALLSEYDFNRITKISDNAIKHIGVQNLFKYSEQHKDSVVLTEQEFTFDGRTLHDEKKLLVHGFIDHIVFDPNNRKMIITEVKTTSGSLNNYYESFEKYHTAMQLGIYTIAAGKIFEKMYPDIPLKEVRPEWNVIAIQSNGLFEIKMFVINDGTIASGMMMYKDLMNRYVFHYKEGWEHSQEYYTNNGLEIL